VGSKKKKGKEEDEQWNPSLCLSLCFALLDFRRFTSSGKKGKRIFSRENRKKSIAGTNSGYREIRF